MTCVTKHVLSARDIHLRSDDLRYRVVLNQPTYLRVVAKEFRNLFGIFAVPLHCVCVCACMCLRMDIIKRTVLCVFRYGKALCV